jgi:uncharacterized membrane protein
MNEHAVNRSPLHRGWRFVRARPRLAIGTIIGLAVLWLAPAWLHGSTRALAAWDAGSSVYLGLALTMMIRSGPSRMHWRARLLTVVAATASLAAIVMELIGTKGQPSPARELHLALAGATVLCSWLLVHTSFALHYAHEHYVEHARDGSPALQFPGGGDPDYLDFLYFSVVIGATSQTADISIASPRLRRFALLHCIVAFLFNTTLLALTINIAAGLF